MATMTRSITKWPMALATLLVSALLFSACSSGQATESPGGSAGPSAPSSPSPVTLPRNGGLVFSRAEVPSTGGLAPDAIIREVDVHGTVGPALVRGVVYRAAPSWAPDGLAFAFLGAHGISVARGGDVQLIAPCHPQACTGLGAPAWSPSGTSLAFSGDIDGQEGLFEISPDGGEPRPIATDLAVKGAPAWSPDSASVAVIVAGDGTSSLQILDVASGQTKRTIDLPGLELGGTVAWSPDGTRLAFEVVGSDQGEHEGIYLVAPDGSDTHLLTACPDEGCVDLSPSFSPDGSWVVFTRARCDEPGSDCFVGDVWVIGAGGADAHALTHGVGLDCCAAWRPIPA